MIKYINQYLDYKKDMWSPATLKSERARLLSVADKINGNPDELWLSIQDLSKYSRKTLWIRVINLWDWLIDTKKIRTKTNPYKEWRNKNGQVFKNAYKRKLPEISLSEATKKIQEIKEDEIRDACLFILNSGIRIHELYKINGDYVEGKGDKSRRLYIKPPANIPSIHRIRYALHSIGLTPHYLRKVRATDLSRKEGVTSQDLLKVFGWSQLQTACSYLAAKRDEEIEEYFKA